MRAIPVSERTNLQSFFPVVRTPVKFHTSVMDSTLTHISPSRYITIIIIIRVGISCLAVHRY